MNTDIMTIGDLKNLIKDLPDDREIYIHGDSYGNGNYYKLKKGHFINEEILKCKISGDGEYWVDHRDINFMNEYDKKYKINNRKVVFTIGKCFFDKNRCIH